MLAERRFGKVGAGGETRAGEYRLVVEDRAGEIDRAGEQGALQAERADRRPGQRESAGKDRAIPPKSADPRTGHPPGDPGAVEDMDGPAERQRPDDIGVRRVQPQLGIGGRRQRCDHAGEQHARIEHHPGQVVVERAPIGFAPPRLGRGRAVGEVQGAMKARPAAGGSGLVDQPVALGRPVVLKRLQPDILAGLRRLGGQAVPRIVGGAPVFPPLGLERCDVRIGVRHKSPQDLIIAGSLARLVNGLNTGK